MEGHVDDIVCRQEWMGDGFEVRWQKVLRLLHYRRGQGEESVVIKSIGPWFFGDRNDSHDLEEDWYMACLQ